MESSNVDSASEVTEDSPKNTPAPAVIKLPGKRVNFPDDSKLVSSSQTPHDPFHKAHETTTEELVEAYKGGCSKWNVKPIPRLLQQLYATHNFTSRSDLLNLKGERLDIRQCEALEDVFKRVRYKTIDLESANLDDESATALFDMFVYYESAEKLNLCNNRNIGPRGWQAAARYIKKTESLECLDLKNCTVTELSMPVLARSLRVGSTITALHMESCNLSGRPLFVLLASLKLNLTVTDLFLADNKLVPSDAIQIATMLKFNWKLKLLDLRNNQIQNVGLAHICDGLVEQREDGLSTLVLWNNSITHVGMNELSRALAECNNLDTVNLGHNAITNEGVLLLKDGLLKNTSILRLGLVATKITCEGAIAVAEYLADNCKLIRLDVRENDIRTGGLMALTLSLKVNRTVLRLDIDKDIKKDMPKEHEEIHRSLLEEMDNYLKRNREIAKDENVKRQVIEAQKALERKTLHRSHEDIHKAEVVDQSQQNGSTQPNSANQETIGKQNMDMGAKSKEKDSVPDSKQDNSVSHVNKFEEKQASALVNKTDSHRKSSSVDEGNRETAGLSKGLTTNKMVSTVVPENLQAVEQPNTNTAENTANIISSNTPQENSTQYAMISDNHMKHGTSVHVPTDKSINMIAEIDQSDNSQSNPSATETGKSATPTDASQSKHASEDNVLVNSDDNTGSQVPNGLLQQVPVSDSNPTSSLPTSPATKTQNPLPTEDNSGVDDSLDEFEKELNDMLASVTNASIDEVTQLANSTTFEDEDIFDN